MEENIPEGHGACWCHVGGICFRSCRPVTLETTRCCPMCCAAHEKLKSKYKSNHHYITLSKLNVGLFATGVPLIFNTNQSHAHTKCFGLFQQSALFRALPSLHGVHSSCSIWFGNVDDDQGF